QVKGKEEPVLAFKLLGAAPAPSAQVTLSGRALSPFIGRQREMAILEEVRDQAASGQGQVVGIAAEAGTGKSRLLYELRRRPGTGAGTQSTAWLSGRCLSYGTGTPYLPILYMLRGEWAIGDGDPPAVVTAKVQAGLERLGLDPAAPLPYLLRLLGVEEGTEPLAELSPQALQARTFSVLRQVILASGGGDGLVVLEIEDLHWADQTSEDFLTFLVEGIPAARALLLGTYRPGYRPPWIEKSYATQIPLRRLTDSESRSLVEASLHKLELPEESLSAILDKAEGNPFFLEELTRSLLERPDVSVPDTVQGVILARIDRLPEEQKRLLQTASVLGREFSQRLLAAVWERPETLVPLLADLKRWEFLYEEPTAEEPFYFFKHGLTQEAVYQTLLTSRRRALHDSAGEAFETLYSDRLEEVYNRLAYHYSKAEAPARAVRYLALSAEKAARGYAHAEAAQALREALVHAERLPLAERDHSTLELALRLAESLLPLARFAETLEVLSLHQDALDRVADAALAGRYHFWMAHTHSYMGNQEEVEVHAAHAIDAARQSGDTRIEGRTWYLLCRDAFWGGRFKEGIEDGRRALDLLETSEDRWWQGQALWVAGFHYYVLGRFEEALEAMDQAHAIWEALQDPRLDPSWSTGFFLASMGDWERGIELCRGGLERAGDPLNTAAAQGFLGYAYLEKGDLPRALETLDEAVRSMRQAGMQQLLGWYSAFLAEACLLAGRPAEARERALEALTVTDGAGFRYGSGFAQRTLGHIAAAEDDPELAEAWLNQALATFRSLDAPFEAARTLLDLVQLAGDQGDLPEAGSRLEEARALFEELRVPAYSARAERLTGSLGLGAQTERRVAPFGV
ncbi:MAG TPA: AAA family ATPase, partial [Thermoanaerobaculia bacterium]|nr:AAA family ATPase [Thermoanaerobaculia bacterium]